MTKDDTMRWVLGDLFGHWGLLGTGGDTWNWGLWVRAAGDSPRDKGRGIQYPGSTDRNYHKSYSF
ncbi:hypothetical protein BDV98DRAFT_576739 [Pterulicium gracile]|uniref:Uncharacterized protein n=1 Tax=Pterulicium gracile TaxID=1884261 RepID=A0A5C3Q4W9_9AGAR|nr:hypothetical protein BDV98DRAFT_576739 [Pterula gracilis]